MEDSDSYEHHVIELRGDDQANSYPSESKAEVDTFRSSFPPSNELLNGQDDVEESMGEKHKKDTNPPPSEGTFRGTARVRARLAAKAQEAAERESAWIDSAHCLSDLETKFQERSKQRKRSFQKAVEEALECKKTGILPRDWEVVPPDGSPKVERVTKKKEVTEEVDHNEGNGVVENGLQGVEVTSESAKGNSHGEGEEKIVREDDKDALKGRRTKAKKKPKSENTEVPIQSEAKEPQNRRLRVMRHLGLSPPPGSPFTPSSITNS